MTHNTLQFFIYDMRTVGTRSYATGPKCCATTPLVRNTSRCTQKLVHLTQVSNALNSKLHSIYARVLRASGLLEDTITISICECSIDYRIGGNLV